MQIKWKIVIRDAAIIWALTFLGGFLVGFAGAAGGARHAVAIALSSLIFSIIGFAISGGLAKNQRFNHLFQVATVVWLTSLVNIALGYSTFKLWLSSSIFIVLTMFLGGWLSFLFVKSDPIRQEENNEKTT